MLGASGGEMVGNYAQNCPRYLLLWQVERANYALYCELFSTPSHTPTPEAAEKGVVYEADALNFIVDEVGVDPAHHGILAPITVEIRSRAYRRLS